MILIFVTLNGCIINAPSFNKPQKPQEDTISDKILKEYYDLNSNEAAEHTVWTFDGYIIDMSLVKLNTDLTYDLTLILMLDDLTIGINKALIDGYKPTDITGLRIGKKITVIGTIDQYTTLSGKDNVATVCFNSPEVEWENMPVQEQNPGSGDNGNTGNQPGLGDNPGDDVTPKPDNLPTKVNFAMINDTHGAFTDSNDGYSIARVDTLIDNLEIQNGDYIKIANGDIFQGSYTSGIYYGYPLVEALDLMDFDAFVIGNHEFDWGLGEIAKYKDNDPTNGEADFPFLGANIFYKNTTTRPEWIDAYTIVDYSGLKVGIIGVIGGTHESSILSSNVADYTFLDDPTNLIKQYSKELRTQKGCDVVVVASHDYDENMTMYNSIANFANDEKIDAIFCAHTHQNINQSVTRTDGISIPVTQNLHKNNTVAEVVLNLDSNGQMKSADAKKHYLSTSYAISNDFTDLFAKYQKDIDDSTSVLGTVSGKLYKSTLGSYATKSMFNASYTDYGYTKIDLAIINTGGVRATINDNGLSNYGVTISDVYNTFTFNNKVVLIQLKGSYINTILDYNNSSGGLYVHKTLSSFNSNTYYNIAVIDYVFTGSFWQGKGLSKAENIVYTDIIMRELVYDYFRDNF